MYYLQWNKKMSIKRMKYSKKYFEQIDDTENCKQKQKIEISL